MSSGITRREFVANTVLLGAGLAMGDMLLQERRASAATTPPTVLLSWLGNQAPLVPSSVAWGVPWPRGAVAKNAQVTVRNAAGAAVAAQAWPMAYWPDGSIKWTGLAIAADSNTGGLMVAVGNEAGPKPQTPVTVNEDAQSITINTGPVTARINKTGQSLIASLTSDGREVARDGRLIAMREDRSQFEAQGILRQEQFTSKINKVIVEQSGPVRAVVKIDGVHAGIGGVNREWLPFSVRLYFTAGLNSVRMVHTFIFDGDQTVDFVKGIGLAFSVPFREETQNRHIRFATDNHNLFSEPVLMAPGYRKTGTAVEYERAQIAGKRIPNLDQMTAQEKNGIQATATWDRFKLNQLSADAWELSKRTNTKSAPVRITTGNRARGLAYLGDVTGGLAVGLKHFWQKYPASFEITNASTPAGDFKVWFWSPDAPAMDVRHYDTVMHSLAVTYEDARDFTLANAYGCANTAELTLWATSETPAAEDLDAMTDTGNAPALLICSPEHYHSTQTLGIWTLPNTPAPGLTAADIAAADTQLDRAFAFYNTEIERRRWYGFWDFGDYRRTYDPIRQQWMYDIGGHGWDATELLPNAWLWWAFLRSGRADIFRGAENMTRNTSEVDVFHIGRLAGLGSRHNVSHWGDGAKEPRINIAFIKRFYYYLTTDERMGDLMHEPLDHLEASLANTFNFNRTDLKPGQSFIRIGPDWLALASNWMCEWERTGDTKYRDCCLTGMKDIGAMPDALLNRASFIFDPATKHMTDVGGQGGGRPGQFLFLFAGDQIAAELSALIDCPEFAKAWNNLCEQFVLNKRTNWYFEPRCTAYAANTLGRQDIEDRAIALYRDLLKFGDNDYFIATLESFDGPTVTQLAKVNPGTSTFTPSLATPEVSQWAINLITMPELFRQFKANPTAPTTNR